MAHSQNCHVAGRHSRMGNSTGGLHIGFHSVRSTSRSAPVLGVAPILSTLEFRRTRPSAVHEEMHLWPSRFSQAFLRTFAQWHGCNRVRTPPNPTPVWFIQMVHKIMVLNYCDDQIWMSPDNALIEEHIKKLQDLKYDLVLEAEWQHV